MDFIQQNTAEFVTVLGLAILALEVLILGFSTFILAFLGLSLTLTGIAMWLGIMPDSLKWVLASNAILTALLASTLWQPLKKMQAQVDNKEVQNDFIGLEFSLDQDIDENSSASHQYSGINWAVKSEQAIAAKQKVKVVKVEVGIFWVDAC